jgi:hypothetical protein
LHLLAELTYYKSQCKEFKQKFATLKVEKRQSESLENTPQDVSMRNMIKQVTVLKSQLADLEDMARYRTIGASHGKGSNAHRFWSYSQELRNQLLGILIINGPENPSIRSLYGKSTDLDVLLASVFDAGDQDHSMRPADFVRDFPVLTLYELVQTLTGAAVHCWIFGSEFLPQNMSCTPMLQKYRECIAALCTYPLECDP